MNLRSVRKSTWWWISLFLVLLVLGVARVVFREKPSPPASVATIRAEKGMPVTVLRLAPIDWEHWMNLYGHVVAARQREVASDQQEYVLEVPVEVGDLVSAGQTLALLDSRLAAQKLEAQRAKLDELASRALRLQRLNEAGGASLQEVESARSAAQEARARFSELKTGMARHRVVAPSAGMILERSVEPGELVTPGRGLFLMADLNELEIRLDVSPEDIRKIRKGQKALIAGNGGYVETTLKRVDPSADPASGLYTAILAVPPGSGLKPLATVMARVRDEFVPMGLSIPYEAIRITEGRPSVFVVSGDTAEERPILTGSSQGESVRVLDGLSPGERIVIKGADRIFPGARIWIQEN